MKIDLDTTTQGAGGTVEALLDAAGVKRRSMRCARGSTIFGEGSSANAVLAIRSGAVKLSVVSTSGKEAVIAMLGPGDFFGEGALANQTLRTARAKAVTPVLLFRISKTEMIRALRERLDFADWFLKHMLRRNIRIEEDLVDQLFNSSETRLARTLLLLAGVSSGDSPHGTVAKISQTTLAEIVGTTRPRVNHFLNKFRKLGFIEYNGGLKVNRSLVSVASRDY